MRTLTLVVRPFTMRQLRAIKLGLIDPITASTGLTRSQVKRLRPHVAIALQRVIDEVNAWKPEDLVETGDRRPETGDGKADDDFFGMAAELVMAGHDRESVWDLTPVQFVWWVGQARRLRARDTRECAALDAAGVYKAIAAAFDKKAAQEFVKWVGELTREERPETGDRRPETNGKARTPGRGLAAVLAQAGETLQEGALNRG
jgi:hypothetical protein